MTSLLGVDAILVGDEPESWTDAGFDVFGGETVIDGMAIACRADDTPPSWRLWTDGDVRPGHIDGLATEWAEEPRASAEMTHPNQVVGIDHIVLASPDLDRTTETFADLGVECRRIREIPGSNPAMQQRFFRLGPVILELVGNAEPTSDGPLSLWGLAFNVRDLDAAATYLGPACSAPKDAVQPGRKIATMRTRDLGISLPIALMTPKPRRP